MTEKEMKISLGETAVEMASKFLRMYRRKVVKQEKIVKKLKQDLKVLKGKV